MCPKVNMLEQLIHQREFTAGLQQHIAYISYSQVTFT